MKEQLAKIENDVDNEKIIRENSDERTRTKDLKAIDQELGRQLAFEKQARKDYELKVLKGTDDRVYQFRLELARQKKTREEMEERNAQDLGDKVLGLQEEVEDERRQRYAHIPPIL